MKALFIGRFQPFHKGHLKVIQDILKKYDEIIIGIGSSQYNHLLDNPFSEEERKKMIQETFKKKNLTNYEIIAIPDIHDPPNWVSHVLSFVKDFDVIISNNALTIKLFSDKGFTVVKTPPFEKEKYSGEVIRKRMINGLKWEDLVPEPVADIIKDFNGVQRLIYLSNKL
jgi:nicotinamide-nucleotide adenylyltransferase